MANILFTTQCNKHCSYCFSDPGPGAKLLSRENYDYFLNFLNNSRARGFGIAGGEPTLHPDFVEYLRVAYYRGFSVSVFTNGTASRGLTDQIYKFLTEESVSPNRVRILVNYDHDQPPDSFLSKLNRWCSLGYNIVPDTHPVYELIELLDVIKDHELRPLLRVALARPSPSGNNNHIPHSMERRWAIELLRLAEHSYKHGIKLGFDCGFNYCQFARSEIGQLYSHGVSLNFECPTVVDVDPDLYAIRCFALNEPRVDLRQFVDLDHLKSFFERVHQPPQPCQECGLYQMGNCGGPCKALSAHPHLSNGVSQCQPRK